MKSDPQPADSPEDTAAPRRTVWLELSPQPEFYSDLDPALRPDPHEEFRFEVQLADQLAEDLLNAAQDDRLNVVITRDDLIPTVGNHLIFFGMRRHFRRRTVERFLIHAQIQIFEPASAGRVKARIVHGSAAVGGVGPGRSIDVSSHFVSRLRNPASDSIDALILGADSLQLEVRRPGSVVHSGNLAAGSTETKLVLDGSASSEDGYYDGMLVKLARPDRTRWIDKYDGDSQTAQLRDPLGAAPSTGEAFEVHNPDQVMRIRLLSPGQRALTMVHEGALRAVSTVRQLTLDLAADARAGFYEGMTVEVNDPSSGHVSASVIDSYNERLKLADVRPDLTDPPTAGDAFAIFTATPRIWELVECPTLCESRCLAVVPDDRIAARVACLESAVEDNVLDPALAIESGAAQAAKRVLFYTFTDEHGVAHTDEVIAPGIAVEFDNRFQTRWTPESLIVRPTSAGEQFALTDIDPDHYWQQTVAEPVVFRWTNVSGDFLAELLAIGDGDVTLPLLRSTSEVANRAGSLWQYAEVSGGVEFPETAGPIPSWIGYDLPPESRPEVPSVDPLSVGLTSRLAIQVPKDSPGTASQGWRFELPPVGAALVPGQESCLQLLFCFSATARRVSCADRLTLVRLEVSLNEFDISAESPEMFAYADPLQSPRAVPIVGRPTEHLSRQRLIFQRSAEDQAGLSLEATGGSVGGDRCATTENALQLQIQIESAKQPVHVFQPIGRALVSFLTPAGDNATAPEVDEEGNRRPLPDPTRGWIGVLPTDSLTLQFPLDDAALPGTPTNAELLGRVTLDARNVPADQAISSLLPWMTFQWPSNEIPYYDSDQVKHELMHKNVALELEEFLRRQEQLEREGVSTRSWTSADVRRLTRDRHAVAATWDGIPSSTVDLANWFPNATLRHGTNPLAPSIGFDDSFDDGFNPPRPQAIVWNGSSELSTLHVFYHHGGQRADWLAFEAIDGQVTVPSLGSDPQISFDAELIRDNPQAAGAQSITLAAGAPSDNDVLNGRKIFIESGSGAGQLRLIEDYDGSSLTAYLDRPWGTIPDSGSTYVIPRNRFQPLLFGTDVPISCDNLSVLRDQDLATQPLRHFAIRDLSAFDTAANTRKQLIKLDYSGHFVSDSSVQHYIALLCVGLILEEVETGKFVPVTDCDRFPCLGDLGCWRVLRRIVNDAALCDAVPPQIWPTISGQVLVPVEIKHLIIDRGDEVPVQEMVFEAVLISPREFASSARPSKAGRPPTGDPSEFPPGVASALAESPPKSLLITVRPDSVTVAPSLIQVEHTHPGSDGFVWRFGVEQRDSVEAISSDGLAWLRGNVRLDGDTQELVLADLHGKASVWGELWNIAPALTLYSVREPEDDQRGFSSRASRPERLHILTPADPLDPGRVDKPVDHLLHVDLPFGARELIAEIDPQRGSRFLVDSVPHVEEFARGIYHGLVPPTLVPDSCLLVWIEDGPTLNARELFDRTTTARAEIDGVVYSGTRTLLTVCDLAGSGRQFLSWDLVAPGGGRSGWLNARLLISSQEIQARHSKANAGNGSSMEKVSAGDTTWVTGQLAIEYALNDAPRGEKHEVQGPVIVELLGELSEDPTPLRIVPATYDVQPASIQKGVGQSLGDNDVVSPAEESINIARTAIDDERRPRFARFRPALGQSTWSVETQVTNGAPILHVRPDGSQVLFGTRGAPFLRTWQFTADGTQIDDQSHSAVSPGGLNDAAFLPDGLVVFSEAGRLKLLDGNIITPATNTAGGSIERVLRLATDPVEPGIVAIVQGDSDSTDDLDVSLWKLTPDGFLQIVPTFNPVLSDRHAVLSVALVTRNSGTPGVVLHLDSVSHRPELDFIHWDSGSGSEVFVPNVDNYACASSEATSVIALERLAQVRIVDFDRNVLNSFTLASDPRGTDLHFVGADSYFLATLADQTLVYDRPVDRNTPRLGFGSAFQHRLFGSPPGSLGVVSLDRLTSDRWWLRLYPAVVVEALQIVDPNTLPIDRCTDSGLSRLPLTTIDRNPQLWHHQAEGIRLLSQLPTDVVLDSSAGGRNVAFGQWTIGPVLQTSDPVDLIAFSLDVWVELATSTAAGALHTDTLILMDRRVEFSVLLNRTYSSADEPDPNRRLFEVLERSAWDGPAVVRSLTIGPASFRFVSGQAEPPRYRARGRISPLRIRPRSPSPSTQLIPANVAAGCDVAVESQTLQLHLEPTPIPIEAARLPGYSQDIQQFLLTRPSAAHGLDDNAVIGLHSAEATMFGAAPGAWARATLNHLPPTSVSAGTALAGTANTITLAEDSSQVESFFVGATLHIEDGSGAGQQRKIASYDRRTFEATVDEPWVTAPSAGSQYVVNGQPGRSYLSNSYEFRLGPRKPGSMMHHAWQVQFAQAEQPFTFVPSAALASREPLLLADPATARLDVLSFDLPDIQFRGNTLTDVKQVRLEWELIIQPLIVHDTLLPLTEPHPMTRRFIEHDGTRFLFSGDNRRLFATGTRLDQQLFEFPEFQRQESSVIKVGVNPDLPVQLSTELLVETEVEGREVLLPQLTLVTRLEDLAGETTVDVYGELKTFRPHVRFFVPKPDLGSEGLATLEFPLANVFVKTASDGSNTFHGWSPRSDFETVDLWQLAAGLDIIWRPSDSDPDLPILSPWSTAGDTESPEASSGARLRTLAGSAAPVTDVVLRAQPSSKKGKEARHESDPYVESQVLHLANLLGETADPSIVESQPGVIQLSIRSKFAIEANIVWPSAITDVDAHVITTLGTGEAIGAALPNT